MMLMISCAYDALVNCPRILSRGSQVEAAVSRWTRRSATRSSLTTRARKRETRLRTRQRKMWFRTRIRSTWRNRPRVVSQNLRVPTLELRWCLARAISEQRPESLEVMFLPRHLLRSRAEAAFPRHRSQAALSKRLRKVGGSHPPGMALRKLTSSPPKRQLPQMPISLAETARRSARPTYIDRAALVAPKAR